MPLYLFFLIVLCMVFTAAVFLVTAQWVEDGRWTRNVWLSLVPLALASLGGIAFLLDRQDPTLLTPLPVVLSWLTIIIFPLMYLATVAAFAYRLQRALRVRRSGRTGYDGGR